jgi:DNA polymerase III subunit delta'
MSFEKFNSFPISTYVKNSMKNDMMGHSWLISGADLVDLEGFVDGWVSSLICLKRDEDASPCGTCEACKRYDLGLYPRYQLKPLSLSRSILVDHVRGFISKFSFKSEKWEKKIGIIYEADCIAEQAQNAFLKTLEEPPPNTFFFLISNRPDVLLDTIRSRCRILNLNNESAQHLKRFWLEELREILLLLKPQSGIDQAWQAAQKLDDLFKSLNKMAELSVMEDESLREEDEEEKAGERKKRLAIAIKSVELEERSLILAAIELWFSAMIKSSQGIADKLDFQAPFDPLLSWEKAIECFDIFEEFNRNLKSPIGARLAIDKFCTNICKK